jgi:hypothetical protein
MMMVTKLGVAVSLWRENSIFLKYWCFLSKTIESSLVINAIIKTLCLPAGLLHMGVLNRLTSKNNINNIFLNDKSTNRNSDLISLIDASLLARLVKKIFTPDLSFPPIKLFIFLSVIMVVYLLLALLSGRQINIFNLILKIDFLTLLLILIADSPYWDKVKSRSLLLGHFIRKG